MNPIPTLPVPPTALQLFIWGANADGQLGLGAFLDNLSKPRRHLWVEKKMQDGAFGHRSGAGLVDIAAGGMHTLLIDENSVVRRSRMFCTPPNSLLDLVVRCK